MDHLRNDPRDSWTPCPDCEDGYRYYINDPLTTEYIDCSKEDYDKTPEEYRGYEICETCNGNCWI